MEKKKSKWIKSAVSKPGAFKAAAERAGKTTREFASEPAHDSGTLGKRARLAKTLIGMKHKHKSPTANEMQRKMYGKKGE